MPEANEKKSIAIVGGGVTGLVCSYRLSQLGFDVDLFEAGSRLGGQISSYSTDGFLFEAGPNTVLGSSRHLSDLVTDLGLRSEVIGANLSAKRRYVFNSNGFFEVSPNPLSFLTSSLMSPYGKFRAASSLFRLLPRLQGNESIQELFAKVFGEEFAEKLIHLFTIGVYAGNSKELLAKHAIPNIFSAFDSSNSLMGAIKKIKSQRSHSSRLSGQSLPQIYSFNGGLSQLISTLATKTAHSTYLRTPVKKLIFGSNGVYLNEGKKHYKKVVLALNYSSAITLLKSSDLIAQSLDFDVEAANVVSVGLGLKAKIHLNGFGVLVDPSIGLNTLGVLIPSKIFSKRAPIGCDSLTLIMGGTFHPTFANRTDEEILHTATSDVLRLFGVGASEIVQSHVWRHPQGIIQPTKKTIESIKNLETLLLNYEAVTYANPLAGGVGVPQRVAQAIGIVDSICSTS
ncbi:MAG: protoporphyrinogen oxidase [Bdellovibrionales bacterium CG10_big_fil_rev_8_21_14_0_10_45_34]|nr:MAG: protoporphyrinogen oxidase [Bdellovibrionales bacterium CG10_big_fil_rev_8_21_14_0_10_45_34]